MCTAPRGDFVLLRDDDARLPSYSHRVQDVFSLLAQVGPGNGHQGPPLQQAGERLDLKERRKAQSIDQAVFRSGGWSISNGGRARKIPEGRNSLRE